MFEQSQVIMKESYEKTLNLEDIPGLLIANMVKARLGSALVPRALQKAWIEIARSVWFPGCPAATRAALICSKRLFTDAFHDTWA